MNASKRRTGRGLVAAGALLAVLASAPARAQDDSLAAEGALGLSAALSSLVYGPVKIVYATGGLLVGGMAWALSGGDSDVSGPILDAAVRGDYVITPDHLRGREDLEFIGRAPGDRAARSRYEGGF